MAYTPRDVKEPKTDIKDDVILIYFRLIEMGFGTYNEVKELNSRVVLQAINWKNFLSDYENAFLEMNKNETG